METKHLFRNNSPGVVGYIFYDESNKRRGGSLQQGDSVWLTERDCVATASAPKLPEDNPLQNGDLTFVTSEGDPEHSRPIGIPGANAPSSQPEPAPEPEESPDEPSGEEEAPEAPDAPTADETARAEAAKEEADREEAAQRKIKEAEEREAKERAEKAEEKTPAEEAAQRVGQPKADVRPPAPKEGESGAEETATEGEKQGAKGEGKRSPQEATGTVDALSG